MERVPNSDLDFKWTIINQDEDHGFFSFTATSTGDQRNRTAYCSEPSSSEFSNLPTGNHST